MSEKRDLSEVLKAMLAVIPDTEDHLRVGLTWIVETLPYQPPEVHGEYWQRGAIIISKHFYGVEPEPGWESDMVAIWMGEKQ